MVKQFSVVVLTAMALSGVAAAKEEASVPPSSTVDFRYSPPWWQTAICLSDDPDKILVGKEGQLLLDYGGGGVRNFGVCLQPEIAGGTKWIRQRTASARTPIVQTWKNVNGVEVLEETFVVIPKSTSNAARVVRTDGEERLQDWAKPARSCPAAFSGVDVAWKGKPMRFQVKVPAGSRMTLVFGLCEGWHKLPGKRPLVLAVEGAPHKVVDPVKDFGPNQPGLYRLTATDENRDGIIDLRVETPETAEDRNAILNALWVFDGMPPTDESVLEGKAIAYARYTGAEEPERRAVVLVTLKNPTAAEVTCKPQMLIASPQPVQFNAAEGSVRVGESTRITVSEKIDSCQSQSKQAYIVLLSPLTLKPGESRQVALTVDRNTAKPEPAASVKQACALRDEVHAWWDKADLPFATVKVPDAGIQAVIESCVRNIWQAREIKQGQVAFHVGPTCYRGLWVVDGSFLLESAAILGRGRDARAGIEYLLSKQKADGGFEVMSHFWKENGIVLWAATRHALLTRDKQWLRSKWPALQRVVKNTQELRARASQDPKALDYRLLPKGPVDGGIWEGGPEYSNTQWCLVGLKAAIAAAHWLGEESDAAAWQKEYDDFYATYRKAAVRDMRKDKFANAYLPTMMGNAGNYSPQKGQWTFCHAVFPGQIFPPGDPLAAGQMAMLRATKVEGLVFDTGWMQDGLWNYFASFYGHAVLWMGDGQEAAQVLYDYANHAAPTRVWREEQKPVGKGREEVGDMPHNWASAEFIRLTVHLLELDRGDELHLLEGIPSQWLGAGMTTRLNGVATPFGPLFMTVQVASDGTTATLQLRPLEENCKAVAVHLPDGTKRNIPPREGGTLSFPVGAVKPR